MSDIQELPPLVGELGCLGGRHQMVNLTCATCRKSQRQIDMENGPRFVPAPTCRWCRKTEAEHEPPTEPNRLRARCPCLGWRENFVPDTSHIATAAQRPSVAPFRSEINGSWIESDEPAYEVELRPSALTDAHRLAVIRELWKLHTESGRINMIDTLYECERQVKERMR